MVGCDSRNVEIMHMALYASPSNPCIINSFLGLRFMKSLSGTSLRPLGSCSWAKKANGRTQG